MCVLSDLINTLAGRGGNSTVMIIEIVLPVSVSVLLLVAVFSFYVTKRVKKTYETSAADDGKDSDIHLSICYFIYFLNA